MKIDAQTAAAAIASTSTDKAAAAAQAANSSGATHETKLKAAREFEAVFVRKMLSSLESTTKLGGKESGMSAGSGIYGSMVTGALSDAISSAGGIGMSDAIVRALDQAEARHNPAAKTATSPTPGGIPTAVRSPTLNPLGAHAPLSPLVSAPKAQDAKQRDGP